MRLLLQDIVSTTRGLQAQIQHTGCVFKLKGTWDIDEGDGRGEFVHGDEGDDGASRPGADEEVRGVGLFLRSGSAEGDKGRHGGVVSIEVVLS